MLRDECSEASDVLSGLLCGDCVVSAWRAGSPTRRARRSRAREGHSVDALAPGGDEGRGTLRKATGSREQALIRGYPNGATHPARGIMR